MFNRTKEIIRTLEQDWEKYFCRVWRKVVVRLNPKNDPILLVSLTRDKEKNILLGGDISGVLSAKINDKLGLMIRDMAKGKLIAKKGLLPTQTPALIVLLPLPRFIFNSSLSELKSLAKDFRGEILVENIPYSYLTILM